MIVLEWLFLTVAPCDASEPRQLVSQDAATPMMQGIIDLHHDIFFFLILILVFVSRILVRALWHFKKESRAVAVGLGCFFFLILPVLPVLYLLCLKAGVLPSFYAGLYKGGLSLGGRALSSFLISKGLPGAFAFAIPCLLQVCVGNSAVLKMDSSGSEGWWKYLQSSEGASTNSGSEGAVPHENHASVSDEGAASPGRPDPDEMVGGDSIHSIQRRLLSKTPFPSAEAIDFARIQAEDLFEVKGDIVRRMAVLDPAGNWMGQGARALDNPRTSTGESSLKRLYSLLNELELHGARSEAFLSLSAKVALRRSNLDEHSTT